MSTTDQAIITELKKAQDETNERLDRLIATQEQTNQLLQWLGDLLQTNAST